MSFHLTIINDDIYDINHIDNDFSQDSLPLSPEYVGSVVNFQNEIRKKNYAEAIERISAAAVDFDW